MGPDLVFYCDVHWAVLVFQDGLGGIRIGGTWLVGVLR